MEQIQSSMFQIERELENIDVLRWRYKPWQFRKGNTVTYIFPWYINSLNKQLS